MVTEPVRRAAARSDFDPLTNLEGEELLRVRAAVEPGLPGDASIIELWTYPETDVLGERDFTLVRYEIEGQREVTAFRIGDECVAVEPDCGEFFLGRILADNAELPILIVPDEASAWRLSRDSRVRAKLLPTTIAGLAVKGKFAVKMSHETFLRDRRCLLWTMGNADTASALIGATNWLVDKGVTVEPVVPANPRMTHVPADVDMVVEQLLPLLDYDSKPPEGAKILICAGLPDDARDWPEPTEDSIAPAYAGFTEAPLTAGLEAIVRDISESVKVHPDAVRAVLPAIVSACVGNAFRIQVSAQYAETCLSRYAVVFADPGERKSATCALAAAPLNLYQRQNQAEFDRAKEAYRFHMETRDACMKKLSKQLIQAEPDARAALEKTLARVRKDLPELPFPARLFAENITSERLVMEMKRGLGGFATISADAGAMLKIISGRYSKEGMSDEDVLLKAHAGDVISRDRVSDDDGICLSNPALAVAWFIQRERLGEIAGKEEFWQSGLVQRINMIAPPSLVGSRFEHDDDPVVDPDSLNRWAAAGVMLIHLRKAIAAAPDSQPFVLCLSDAAMAARRRFANELEERQANSGDLQQWSGFASKCAGEAARLGALLHLAELALKGPLPPLGEMGVVSVDIWDIAERHQRAQLHETLRLAKLGRFQAYKYENSLINWVRADWAERRIFSIRDVQRAGVFGKGLSAEDVKLELTFVEKANLIRRERYRSDDVIRYWVNPWLR